MRNQMHNRSESQTAFIEKYADAIPWDKATPRTKARVKKIKRKIIAKEWKKGVRMS